MMGSIITQQTRRRMQIHVIDGGGLAADNHYDQLICQFTLLCAAEHKGRGVCDSERSLRVEASATKHGLSYVAFHRSEGLEPLPS